MYHVKDHTDFNWHLCTEDKVISRTERISYDNAAYELLPDICRCESIRLEMEEYNLMKSLGWQNIWWCEPIVPHN